MTLRVKGDLETIIGHVRGKMKKALNAAAKEAAEQLAEMVKENIDRGYDRLPWGDIQWKWLSDMYAKSIGAKSPADHPGLVITTALRESVKVSELGNGKFEVMVTDWKAEIHEYGMYDIPKRPFFRPAVFVFREGDMAKDIIEEHMMDVFGDEL